MAINLKLQYPLQVDNPTAEYPYGKPRNIIVSGDNTGTPLDVAWFSDTQGFYQKILTEAGTVPSESPDNAINSQLWDSSFGLIFGEGGAGNVPNSGIQFDSMTDLLNATWDVTVDNSQVSVSRLITGTDRGTGLYQYMGSVPKSNHNGVTFISSTVPPPVDASNAAIADFLNGLGETSPGGAGIWMLIQGICGYDFTLNVGTGSYFTEWSSAIEYLFGLKHNNIVASLNLIAGHQITSGLDLFGGDYSWIKITSDDVIVTLDPTYPNTPASDLIRGDACQMPKLSCLIDMNDIGGNGYSILNGSNGYVESLSGVINTGKIGINCVNSIANATNSNFSGANEPGAFASNNAKIYCDGANLSNCCKNTTVTGALYVQNCSFTNASSANINNSGTGGVVCVNSSNINIEGAIINNSQNGNGITIEHTSVVCARFASVVGSQGRGVRVYSSSKVTLSQSTITDSLSDNVQVIGSSKAFMQLTIIERAGASNLHVGNSSMASVLSTTLNQATTNNISISNGSCVEASGAIITNAILGHGVHAVRSTFSADTTTSITGNNVHGVFSESGSDCRIVGATVGLNNVTGSNRDLAVLYGGKIAANFVTTTVGFGSPSPSNVLGVTYPYFNVLQTNGYITT